MLKHVIDYRFDLEESGSPTTATVAVLLTVCSADDLQNVFGVKGAAHREG
jgi:hypothetical protein